MAGRNMLVYNAKIYRSGEQDYTWMVFNAQSGYISRTGTVSPPLEEHKQENCIDMQGKRILPGLHEAHIHVGSYGQKLLSLELNDCSSITELQDRLSKYVKQNPMSEWIVGIGWEQDRLGRYPSKEDLDMVCSGRPVVLKRVCLHIAVLNSKALELLGITKETPDPDGGQIDRYSEGHRLAGIPNGILRECSSMLKPHIYPSKENIKIGIKKALNQCLQFGATCVQSLESGPDQWVVYKELAEEDQLPIRVVFVPYYEDRTAPDFPKPGETRGKMLSCDRVKLFADGALGPCTAALSLPYKGAEHKGLLLQSQMELNRLVARATSEGYRLEIHAIGDAAADSMLTALEAAQVAPQKRPIMVHCQILRSDLIERMKARGVIASIQPQFLFTDARWLGELLPEPLLAYAYAWKSLLMSGVACCGGSDAPVESPQPLLGIYDAIFRSADCRGPDHQKTFRSEECLSVEESIDLYTKGGAYAACRDLDLGQLLPGYQADFIVLDAEKDVCDHPEYFCQATVNQVWVAGQRKL